MSAARSGRIALPSRPAATAFVVFAMAMSVKALYAWFPGVASAANNPMSAPVGGGNAAYVLTWLLLYGLSAVVLAVQCWRGGIPARLFALLPFGFYVIASASWADDRAASATPATMLALDIVVAAALAAVAHPARVLRVLASLNAVLALLSLVALAIVPTQVISDPTRPGLLMSGELFGVYDTKGTLCMSAVTALIILGFLPSVMRPWLRAAAAAVLVVVLLLANSAGPLVAGGVATGCLLAARAWPRLRTPILSIAVAAATLWSMALPFLNVSAATEMVGRSANLTGRGTFWPMAPDFIKAHPLLGYGYAAFFHETPYAPGWKVWEREQWFFTPEFHNAFLDILIGLGVVGALFYLAMLAGAAMVLRNRTLDPRCIEVLVACLIVFIMGNATEFQLLAHNTNATIYLFFCFLCAGRDYGPPLWTAPGLSRGNLSDRQPILKPSQ